MNLNEVLEKLKNQSDALFKEQYSRFGIPNAHALGVRTPQIKALAKELGKNQQLGIQLWQSDYHEAKSLAILLLDPKQTDSQLMDKLAADVSSWDLCDGLCTHLFRKTDLAYPKAFEWADKEEEFIRRCGLVLMTVLTLHDKKVSNEQIRKFIPYAEKYAWDGRNFVKKAANWLLRQIGKRNLVLNKDATILAIKLKQSPSASARWVGSDALRELTDPEILERISNKVV